MINVAIIEGWGAGKWHSKDFSSALGAAGYSITDPVHADIIIAHSTACYSLPTKTPANMFMLIDPPYWPGKSIFQRRFAGPSAEESSPASPKGLKYKLTKLAYGAFYAAQKPNYASLVFKQDNRLDFLQNIKDKSVILVRNQQDNQCSPDIEVAISSYSNIKYVVLPGEHDDFYSNPQPYINLLPK